MTHDSTVRSHLLTGVSRWPGWDGEGLSPREAPGGGLCCQQPAREGPWWEGAGQCCLRKRGGLRASLGICAQRSSDIFPGSVWVPASSSLLCIPHPSLQGRGPLFRRSPPSFTSPHCAGLLPLRPALLSYFYNKEALNTVCLRFGVFCLFFKSERQFVQRHSQNTRTGARYQLR